MSVQLSNQGIRLWCDERSRTPLLDFYTNAAPAGWGAASTQFEIALATRGALADVSNLSSVRLDGVLYSNRDGTRLFSQTLAGSALNNALTLDTWEDGSQEHALFLFTQAQMNFIPSGTISITLWIVVTALTIAGEEIVCGTGTMTMTDPGAFTSAGSPPANPGAAISLGDADARYARINEGSQLILTSQTTGTQFYALLDGATDAAANLIFLPLTDLTVPSQTSQISPTGQFMLINRTTNRYLPFNLTATGYTLLQPSQILFGSPGGGPFALSISGPDTAPAPVISLAA